ncbi:YrhC family protein [Peribacillus sp. SCS-37]|uniref:YrhC family protein n=1 Tax=Paraperibacillus esterisolvens TaxID=3115296 RepID=UPI003905FF4D
MIHNKQLRKLHEKMTDYKRFAYTLICLGVFFYLGVLVDSYGKGLNPNFPMMWAAIIAIAGAGLFFLLSAKYKKLLLETEDSDNNISS